MKLTRFQKLKRIRNIFGLVLLAGFMLLWDRIDAYEFLFLNYRKSPDVISGRTIPYNVKSSVAFVTQTEFEQMSLAQNALKEVWLIGVFLGGPLTIYISREEERIDKL